jgi:HSP20 family protein
MVSLSTASSNVEWVPHTDIYENENSLVVRMEIAGVSEEDIQISVSDRTLIVRGRRPDPCRMARFHFRQMEINYGVFEKRLILPRGVDGKKAKARYRNGFLVIEFPKLSKSDPVRLKVMIERE